MHPPPPGPHHPTVRGMKTCSAVRATTSTMVSRLVRRRGDVEEGDLVGTFGVVAGSQLDRVALVGQVDESHALDDTATGDVEAGDQADAAHAATPSSTLNRPSTMALPTMAPASRRPPAARPASATRSSAPDTPPDATTGSDVVSSRACSPGQVGAFEHAVAGHRGGDDGADGLLLPELEQLGHG